MKDFDQLSDMFKVVAKEQQACLKQCRIMLAGFKALGEQDIDYMDRYMMVCGISWKPMTKQKCYIEIIWHISQGSNLKWVENV